jgi:hypothetical protein
MCHHGYRMGWTIYLTAPSLILSVHDTAKGWGVFSDRQKSDVGSPDYNAAFCGFHDLADHLIIKNPEQVNAAASGASSGLVQETLPCLLPCRKFTPQARCRRGCSSYEWTPLHLASYSGSVDITRWLLDHGAGVNARNVFSRTPIHVTARRTDLKIVQVLLCPSICNCTIICKF